MTSFVWTLAETFDGRWHLCLRDKDRRTVCGRPVSPTRAQRDVGTFQVTCRACRAMLGDERIGTPVTSVRHDGVTHALVAVVMIQRRGGLVRRNIAWRCRLARDLWGLLAASDPTGTVDCLACLAIEEES